MKGNSVCKDLSTTATGAGTTYGIVSNTSDTLTLASNLVAGIVAPVGYKIRKQWTIASVFGPNNESGLQGGTATTADLIQLWNGASLDTYYYQTTPSLGWRRVGEYGHRQGRHAHSILFRYFGHATAVGEPDFRSEWHCKIRANCCSDRRRQQLCW